MRYARIARVIAVALCGAGAISAAAGPAAAEGPTKRCYPGAACFYYNSNQKGAIAPLDDGQNSYDLVGQVFNSNTGNGSGKKLKNNAASVDSRMKKTRYCIHFNSYYKGPYDILEPQTRRQLEATYNDNASTGNYPKHDGSTNPHG